MPGINLGLQVLADLEQTVVLAGELLEDLGRTRPERVRRQAGTGNAFAVHELHQGSREANAVFFKIIH